MKLQMYRHYTYNYDIKEVIIAKSLQYFLYGDFGDLHAKTRHAPTGIHQDDDILGVRGGLDIPG